MFVRPLTPTLSTASYNIRCKLGKVSLKYIKNKNLIENELTIKFHTIEPDMPLFMQTNHLR